MDIITVILACTLTAYVISRPVVKTMRSLGVNV